MMTGKRLRKALRLISRVRLGAGFFPRPVEVHLAGVLDLMAVFVIE